jgi:hypothetical protein
MTSWKKFHFFTSRSRVEQTKKASSASGGQEMKWKVVNLSNSTRWQGEEMNIIMTDAFSIELDGNFIGFWAVERCLRQYNCLSSRTLCESLDILALPPRWLYRF